MFQDLKGNASIAFNNIYFSVSILNRVRPNKAMIDFEKPNLSWVETILYARLSDSIWPTSYFEYDQLRLSIITTNVLNLNIFINSVSPGLLSLHWLRHLPSLSSPACFAGSQGFTDCHIRVKVKCRKEVGHTQSVGHNSQSS